MKLSYLFFLLLCGMAVCQIREYIYVNKSMNFASAQQYCRENFVDLATITTDAENQRLGKVLRTFNIFYSWIGLSKTALGSNTFQWSDGEPSQFFKWGFGQPSAWGGFDGCVTVWLNSWSDISCTFSFPFYCSWRYVLVEDSKTWEEALEYCRTYYTGLASLVFPAQLVLAKNATDQTQTVSVWTGLHFLNGQWASVNHVPLKSLVSLPSCPALRYRCGAYNTKMNIWENRDCNEKLNFICY